MDRVVRKQEVLAEAAEVFPELSDVDGYLLFEVLDVDLRDPALLLLLLTPDMSETIKLFCHN